MRPADEQPGIIRALRVLRERWWIVAVAAVVCVAASVAITVTSVKQYQATAKLLFKDSGLEAAVGGSSPAPSGDPEGDKATNTQLVTTYAVADQVKRVLRLPDDPDALIGMMTVTSEQNGSLVDVTATDPDPGRAARVATAFAQQYVAYSQRQQREKVRQGEDLIDQRIAELAPDDTAGRRSLEEAKRKLILVEAVQTGNAEVVDVAEVPGSPSSPNPKRNVAIALFFGLLLGVGIAFLLDVIDRRIKEVEDFESLYGIPALASVPERRGPAGGTTDLEPYRILRGSLALLSATQDAPTRSVLVTSAVSGEGKTTVAAGLATAIALAGSSVVLVEADLRRPMLHRQFDLGPDRRGLTTALVGGMPVTELLRRPQAALRNLQVLPSGPVLPASAELLRSGEMALLLEELRQHAEFIVLDAPPLLPVADAQVLLTHPQVDACVIVARAFYTTREQVRQTRAVLERQRVSQVGLVVNGLRQQQAGYEYAARPAHGGGARVPAGR
jgi:capsular exopolysaccharide synthesis family protein